MHLDTLEDLYLKHLKDLYSAHKLTLGFVRKIADLAHNEILIVALNSNLMCIQSALESLEKIALRHDEIPTGTDCDVTQCLIDKAENEIASTEFGQNKTRDAMITMLYYRLIQFVIACYETLADLGEQLQLLDDKKALGKLSQNIQKTLNAI